MAFDHETYHLFEPSNCDAYDSGSDRYGMVLREGLRQHNLTLDDVRAVTQDMGMWVICDSGLFRGSLRGMMKKRAEIDPFIPYSAVSSIGIEPSGPHTRRIVVGGGPGKALARIDFSAGGMDNTPQMAAAHCDRVCGILRQAAGAAHV